MVREAKIKIKIGRSKAAEKLYRLIERVDGERGKRLIKYKIAQKIKIYLLTYIF
jgi:hypothetical protein